ncbi:Por secretion system C-terminal sorting domain-containing protein [Halpernia humi]|uniref:Por secretion system C-terminal sorting domain-containing protein n=1 Tax=Halpernia humi TaxID=493375 RepID=A0A1H5V2I6_9FLAO|nr:zinc-dependent metalloprotease [Halpernia humi]SEF80931.1 Por secretion system C-terminal sorting domain-containing protein [Halpernia humi]
MKNIFTTLLCLSMVSFSFAQWRKTSFHGKLVSETVKDKAYYSLDLSQLRSQLSTAKRMSSKNAPVEISLPNIEGKMEKFEVYSFPVMDETLASQYQLGSYYGVSKTDPTATVRFSVAPNDFQSTVFRTSGLEFIEPANLGKTVYGIHLKTDKSGTKGFFCSTDEPINSQKEIDNLLQKGNNYVNGDLFKAQSSDKKYRTMRLALSVTGEYTQYFGGVAGALTQMNATMTRVNGVLEKDLGLHLNMINNTTIIYTNPSTDPYSAASTGAGGAWNTELMNTLHSVVGDANFDIGHLFGASGGGGNAGCIGCVCNNTLSTGGGATNSYKGSGFTSPADGKPFGDNFDIDYVVHEMGHQLGANHTWSFGIESGSTVQAEPGSGSTIMGYAGITGATDVQAHSDALFHTLNISQIQTNLALGSKTCDVETAITNNPPVVAALTNYTIPKSTAFVLTGSATDAEGDPLTYIWEQTNDATSKSTIANLGNKTNGADFRVWTPTTSPTRYFPKLSTVLSGSLKSTSDWEAASTVARTMNFRLTVRDNNPDVTQQQTAFASNTITVGSAAAFTVDAASGEAGSPIDINWAVSGTTASPYNVANVKIDYTNDDGATWTVLSNSTANNGTASVTFPDTLGASTPYVRVSAIGNVFFAVNKVTLTAATLKTSETKVNKLQLYPNPAKDVLNVKNISAKSTYKIYDTTGKLVASGNLNGTEIKVNNLPKGVYVITLNTDGKAQQSKFIKE